MTNHPASHPVSPVMNALIRDSDRVVLEVVGEKIWTGKEVHDAINGFAHALEKTGLSDGKRVALLAGNSAEVLFLHNSIGLTGACLVPLHPMGSVEDHLFAIDDAGVEALIYDPAKFSSQANEIRDRSSKINAFFALGDDPLGTNLISEAGAHKGVPFTPRPIDPNAVTRLGFSGGTTGKPKAIPGSARVAGYMMQIILCEWEWPEEPRCLSIAPLSHAGGVMFTPVLLKHGSMVVLPTFEPRAVMEAIQKYNINCSLMVPTMIYALLDHPDLDEFDLSSLETIFYGASLMSPARLKEAIERIGPIFFQFYGQAEAPMTVTVMRKSEHDPNDLQRLASCGRPVPFVDVALLDEDNQPVPDGDPGEICVRGPLVMDGYLNRDELNRETFAGGWLHTGDVAVKDPDGFLRIVDRKKDMIVTGGFNVFPSEIENVISQHPAVAQVAVYGVPDEKWGEAVTAAIVLRAGESVNNAEIVELVRDHKGAVHAPKRIRFLDEIPQTAVGKPDKKRLKAEDHL